ncbi:MAG: outer-membrane lipoprotein carrier protein LolA [Pseudomonadota bacterium]
MVSSTLIALALIWTLGQQAAPVAMSTLQLLSSDEEVTQPVDDQAESPAPESIAETITPEPDAPSTQDSTRTPIAEVAPLPTVPAQDQTGAPIVALSDPADDTVDQIEPLVPETQAPSTDLVTRHVEGTNGHAVFLERARLSLSSAKTATGRFTQANADGSLYTGEFALSRPGKLRFDYDDPVPVLIVSDGTTVAMEDRDLETVDRIPLGTTPLGLILDDDLQLTDDIVVNSVIERDATFEITVEDASGEMPGTLTMLFDKAENALTGWRAVDAEFNTTRVSLIDVKTNTRINPRQFILRDAEDEEDER